VGSEVVDYGICTSIKNCVSDLGGIIELFLCIKHNLGILTFLCGPGSSVNIVTVYGLDGPGSNPVGDEIFRLSRSALGLTQPPVKWVPGLSRG